MQWSRFKFELVRKLIERLEGDFSLDSANELLARLEVTHKPVVDDNEHEGSSDEIQELSETALKQVLVGALDYVLDPTLTNKKTIIYKDIQTTPHEAIAKRAHKIRTRPHKHSIKSCICKTHAM